MKNDNLELLQKTRDELQAALQANREKAAMLQATLPDLVAELGPQVLAGGSLEELGHRVRQVQTEIALCRAAETAAQTELDRLDLEIAPKLSAHQDRLWSAACETGSRQFAELEVKQKAADLLAALQALDGAFEQAWGLRPWFPGGAWPQHRVYNLAEILERYLSQIGG